MKIACAQYPIGKFDAFTDWRANAARWVGDAKADLLVFPEYGGMELTSLLPSELQADLHGQIAAMAEFQDGFVETYAGLARQHGVHILAPSLPVASNGAFHNRAWLFAPNGKIDFQEKRQMTRFEKEQWGIAGSPELKIFDLGEAKVGVAICYDIEFPLIAHAMVQAGADLILAPSCTDTLAGANRVHVGARARALENQVYVALAPTVGEAAWSPAVDVNIGWAGIYATPDRGFPDDGVLAKGEKNRPAWVRAELDFDKLRASRKDAQVFTRADWDSQAMPGLGVTQIDF